MRRAIVVILAASAAACARSPAPVTRPAARLVAHARVLDLEEVRRGHLGVKSMVRGRLHSCALLEDGSVHCWGVNDHGQLGSTSTEECHLIEGLEFPCTSRPTLVPRLSKVTQLVLGSAHTCALLENGTVQCWGDNALGQLGDGPRTTMADSSSPTVVPGLDGVVEIAAGAEHTCALTHAWSVLCWGRGTDGAVGVAPSKDVCRGIDSRIPCTRSPTLVVGLPTIGGLMLGEDVTCVFPHDGRSRCWKRDDE